jgi:hypothetical protein
MFNVFISRKKKMGEGKKRLFVTFFWNFGQNSIFFGFGFVSLPRWMPKPVAGWGGLFRGCDLRNLRSAGAFFWKQWY